MESKLGVIHFDPNEAVMMLDDADAYVTVILADGSQVRISGDGILDFYTNGDLDTPVLERDLYQEASEGPVGF